MFKLKLHWQILIAIALAVAVGATLGSLPESAFASKIAAFLKLIGDMFLNALKMIIVPLIVSSLIVGVAGVGGAQGLGRLGGKTVLFYTVSSLFAILIGLMFVNLITPGVIDGVSVKDLIPVDEAELASAKEKIAGQDASSILNVFRGMFPPNILQAATDNGQLLGVIVFSLLYGFFITKLESAFAEHQYNFWQGMQEIMMKLINLIMRFAPLGVFALVATVFVGIPPEQWHNIAQALGLFSITVLLSLGFHMFITLPLFLHFFAKVKPSRHYKAMSPALLTAFSTASSSGTLPLTMECVQDNAKVSKRTSSFVLPLGATVNMDGTALYECVAAMFIAQAYGIDLTFSTQFTIVTVALLTSIGVAGIPAASLIAISIILTTIGLPLEGIALLFAVDRLLDMCRTATNVFSDSCAAVIIARSEGEEGLLPDTEKEEQK